jgi:type II secretory pathway component GspD/PulD (secretin)
MTISTPTARWANRSRCNEDTQRDVTPSLAYASGWIPSEKRNFKQYPSVRVLDYSGGHACPTLAELPPPAAIIDPHTLLCHMTALASHIARNHFLGLLASLWILALPGFAQVADTAKLVHPEVADRISLTDPQRIEVQQLLQARAEAIATAKDASDRETARRTFDEKILAILNDEQKALFASLAPSQKLTFQFREMKWDDVLQWFAEQQDLTLVMDRTPPGVFTYSDTRTYSPAEGIDLLNSVLMTRNFTLVRREKMLVVMELTDSIPLELIPRVTQEELVKRGRFELVSVIFPLGGRPIDAVLNEVKPYLSSYGRAVPLAQGSQVLVIETAGKMRTINELIASVPVPKPNPKLEPTPPPQPVFTSYPLGSLDADRVLKTVQTLIPSDRITVDPKTGVLSAYVIPDQHTAIKNAIEQMIASATNLPGNETVAYQSSKAIPDDFRKQMLGIAPNAAVVVAANRVLVTASPEDQKVVRAALAGLDLQPVMDSRSMKVFEIDPAIATATETAIKAFLPTAQVGANSAAGSLIVRGTENDIHLAEEILQLWTRGHVNKSLQLRAFPLDRVADSKWLTSVQKFLPDASAWLSADGKQLMLLASAKDIARMDETLPQLLALLPKQSDRQWKVYVLSKNQLARRALLTAELPSDLSTMKLVDGTIKQELLASGTPEQHALFAAFLETMNQPGPTPPPSTGRIHPIDVANSSLVVQLLSAEFPEAKITVDKADTSLTVIADEPTQKQVSERLAALVAELPKKTRMKLESYSVAGMTASALNTALTPLLANARVSADATKNRLLISADEKTHEDIQSLVQALDATATADQQKLVVVYPVQHATPTQIKTILDQIMVGTVILADDKLKQVVATGTIEAQATVKATVEQMDRPKANALSKEVRTFDTKKVQASSFLPVLQKLWPDMELAADNSANKIIASGSVDDLAKLGQAMERLVASPDGSPQSVKTYAVPAGDMLTLASILGQIAPQAILSTDATSRTVTAWASDEQHQRIEQALEQISKTAQNAKVPATYIVKPTQVASVQTALLSLFPSASVAGIATTGQLIVVASDEQQKRIAQVIEMLASGPNAADRTVRVFRLDPERMDTATAVSGLQAVLPSQIRLEPNTANQTILAIGTPDELNLAAKKLEELQQQLPEPDEVTTRVYAIRHGSTASALTVLQAMMPKVSMVQDATTRTLSANAKKRDHDRIEAFLKDYDRTREPATYMVKPTQAAAAQSSLKALFPFADVTGDATTGQIVVVAESEQQKQIAKVIEMLGTGPNAAERTVRVFGIDPSRVDLTALISTLQSTLPPNIRLEANARNYSILAIGTPEDLNRVAVKLDEVLKQLPNPEPMTSVVYPLKHGTAAGAYALLTTLLPRTSIIQDATSKTIAATASRGEHDKIREVLATYDVPRQEQLETQVYRLKQGNASGLASMLVTLMPQGAFYGGRDDGVLVATATKEQQERIATIVKGYDAAGDGPETRVFPLTKADAASLRTALAASSNKINVVADAATNSLIVTASSNDLQRISEVVKSIEQGEGSGKTTRYFPLGAADPLPLSRALTESFPKAKFGADATNGGLFATGDEQELESISKIVSEVNQQPGKLPSFRAFPLKHANAENVSKSLTTALGTRSTAGITFQRDAKTVFAVGTKQDLTNIEQMIAQMDVPESGINARRLEIISLRGVDGKSIATALESLFKDSAIPAEIKYDTINEQLFVTGDPRQLALIKESLQTLAPPKRELAIFQLEDTDPNSFKIVADALFEDEPLNSSPSITIDSNQQQLLVRGTQEQIGMIRKLLTQLGEPGRTESLGTGSSPSNPSRLRVVPIHRNPKALLENVERLWPMLRGNPIQVVDPKQINKEPAAPPPAALPPQGNPNAGGLPALESENRRRLVAIQPPEEIVAEQPSSLPPVIIVAGEQQWTIASDDPEALARLDQLLATLLNPIMEPYATAGNYSVYILRHSDAKQLAALLTDLFRPSERGSRTTFSEAMQRVKIVADTRINALVIGGNRADRKVIEELLGVFDSKDLIDRLQRITPILVPLQSASAKNVSDIVKEVYKSQLTSGAGRDPLDIPEGVSSDVATILQQINAQSSSPLLTLSIDDPSNTLVLRGPSELTEEVKAFITSLDQQAASAPARRVQVLRLESTNSKNLEKAMKLLYAK